MIRITRLLAVLIFVAHVPLTLVSCTSTAPTEDEMDSPIEDSDVADAGASAGNDEFDEGAEQPQAAAQDSSKDQSKDDLESEFDQAPAQAEAQPAGEQKLEDEIAGDDLDQAITPDKKEDDVINPDEEAGPAPTPVVQEKIKVRDIRYLANASGGTVVIETSQPVPYRTRMNHETQQFVIELSGVELPESLRRPFNTKDFNSRVGSINAYQDAGSDTARVVIQMAAKTENDPVVQQEGTSLVVIPPSLPTPVARHAAPEKPTSEQTSEGSQPLAARTLDEFLTGNQKFYGRSVSLQVKDADVRDVINFLSEESGANIVMSDDVRGKISLKLRRVAWDQALVMVMRAKELGYVRQGNVLRINTLKALAAETEAANKIIEAGKALVPAIVQVIPINYASMEDISKNLSPFMSKEGKILADQRTNTLIVTDKAEVVERVQKIVKTLDIPPMQVSIESKIVEAVETFERFVGINWGFTGSEVPLSSAGGANGAPVNLNFQAHSATQSADFAGGGPFATSLNIGTLDIFGDLTAALTLAERESLAKVISSPRISSMNREKSTISQKGENVSIIQTRSETTGIVTKSEKRTPFSLELSVTPQVTNDGAVIMDLDVKREFLGAVVDAEMASQPVNSRTAKTKIMVRNGQTAVIGGIYTSDETEASTGIPGLMHIPVLGWLFKNKAVNRSKNELLIFLTPRILAQQDDRR